MKKKKKDEVVVNNLKSGRDDVLIYLKISYGE